MGRQYAAAIILILVVATSAGAEPTPITGTSAADLTANIAAEAFADTADLVLVARDDAYADALSAGVLQADGPLLLVPSSGLLPSVVTEQLQRLMPSRIVVLGGAAAISEETVESLRSSEPHDR